MYLFSFYIISASDGFTCKHLSLFSAVRSLYNPSALSTRGWTRLERLLQPDYKCPINQVGSSLAFVRAHVMDLPRYILTYYVHFPGLSGARLGLSTLVGTSRRTRIPVELYPSTIAYRCPPLAIAASEFCHLCPLALLENPMPSGVKLHYCCSIVRYGHKN